MLIVRREGRPLGRRLVLGSIATPGATSTRPRSTTRRAGGRRSSARKI